MNRCSLVLAQHTCLHKQGNPFSCTANPTLMYPYSHPCSYKIGQTYTLQQGSAAAQGHKNRMFTPAVSCQPVLHTAAATSTCTCQPAKHPCLRDSTTLWPFLLLLLLLLQRCESDAAWPCHGGKRGVVGWVEAGPQPRGHEGSNIQVSKQQLPYWLLQ